MKPAGVRTRVQVVSFVTLAQNSSISTLNKENVSGKKKLSEIVGCCGDHDVQHPVES